MGGRGVGDLKKIGNEQTLNAELIQVIKELNEADLDAGRAMATKQYAKVLTIMPKQLSMLEKIEHHAIIKLIRLEYAYKEIDKVLKQYEEHIRNETQKLRAQEKAIRREQHSERVKQIRSHIHDTRRKLEHFTHRIHSSRDGLRHMKKAIRESCKRRIVRIRKAYDFA